MRACWIICIRTRTKRSTLNVVRGRKVPPATTTVVADRDPVQRNGRIGSYGLIKSILEVVGPTKGKVAAVPDNLHPIPINRVQQVSEFNNMVAQYVMIGNRAAASPALISRFYKGLKGRCLRRAHLGPWNCRDNATHCELVAVQYLLEILAVVSPPRPIRLCAQPPANSGSVLLPKRAHKI